MADQTTETTVRDDAPVFSMNGAGNADAPAPLPDAKPGGAAAPKPPAPTMREIQKAIGPITDEEFVESFDFSEADARRHFSETMDALCQKARRLYAGSLEDHLDFARDVSDLLHWEMAATRAANGKWAGDDDVKRIAARIADKVSMAEGINLTGAAIVADLKLHHWMKAVRAVPAYGATADALPYQIAVKHLMPATIGWDGSTLTATVRDEWGAFLAKWIPFITSRPRGDRTDLYTMVPAAVEEWREELTLAGKTPEERERLKEAKALKDAGRKKDAMLSRLSDTIRELVKDYNLTGREITDRAASALKDMGLMLAVTAATPADVFKVWESAGTREAEALCKVLWTGARFDTMRALQERIGKMLAAAEQAGLIDPPAPAVKVAG